jgi:Glycosyl hydrolase family 12
MHRPAPPHRRSVFSGRRGRVVALVAAASLLFVGAVLAGRQMGSGKPRNALSAADAGIRPSATPGLSPARPGKPTPAPRPTAPAPSPVQQASQALEPASDPSARAAPAAGSAQCTNPQFTTSSPTGIWGDGPYFVYNNMWNISGYSVTQTLYACSFSNWYVVANMNNDSGNGAVKTYPNVQENFNEQPISSFNSITSTFAETSPHVGIYEDAYDMWLNGVASSGSTEVMIWTENFNQVPAGSVVASLTLDGRAYQVWKNGSYIAFVADTNFTSGTMNLLQFYDWIIGQGWIPSSSTLGQIDYGAELVSTNGAPATFSFTNFSISTS